MIPYRSEKNNNLTAWDKGVSWVCFVRSNSARLHIKSASGGNIVLGDTIPLSLLEEKNPRVILEAERGSTALHPLILCTMS